ncbi:MAG: response regulator, partial [Bacteroidota bacterium]
RSLSNNMVYSLLEDRKGTIWVGTQKGLNYYEPSTNQFERVKPKKLENLFFYDMVEDEQGNIWIGSRNKGIFKYVPEEDSFYNFSTVNRPGQIVSNQIIEVTQLKNGKLCFGTLGGGVLFYDPNCDEFSHLGLKEGLLDPNVYQVQEDSKGRLWVSTNKGLSMYDTLAQTFTHHDVSQGLPSNQFNFRSSYQDKQGFMYFGTVNGLCYFHPDSLEITPQESALYFNNFKLFSREVPITPQGVLPQHIDYTKEIELEYHQNVLEFSFVNIDYFSASPTQFSYFLEGFEEEWNEAVYQRSATYTNLSPGSYTFHLKVVNGSNGNTLAERNIKLAVRSPWWLSPMALGIYGVLLVVAVVLFARFNRFLEKQKMALKLERLEKEQSNELTQHKLNFFTYITHEFKTPLTLIIFQIDRILENTDHWIEASTPDFLRIKRNASRLHRLIDQLMEFRKIESDHASLELRRGDIIPFVKDTFEAFHPLFSNKQITNSFESNCSHFHAYFDADKIEKILTNLLSNAIKSTEEFGEINLSLGIGEATDSSDFKWLTIDISDTGEGILASDSEKVFLPFYQKKSTGKSMGSGIGLTLVNSLIAFLDGKMELKSTPNQGTTITLQLPLYPLHPKDKELHRVIRGNKNLQIDPTLYEEEEETLSNSLPVPDNLTLMIVEDSRDLRHFLSRHFSSQYHVVVASNGKDALDKIEQAAPDLIVSDVMMPQMDGLELCKQLKTQVHTSHIPLILLSARSEIQHKLEGLNIGADVYLPKPFNLKEVELTIKNLVQARKNLRQHFLQFGQWPLEEIPSNNKEQEFLKRVLEIVEKNYQDSSLSVVTLSEELGVSRSLLYLKLKKIADLSATELIKTVRMKHAVRLLRSGCSVADTAYQTGFTDPNYFGRIFKKHYNIPPSQFSQEPESSSQKT